MQAAVEEAIRKLALAEGSFLSEVRGRGRVGVRGRLGFRVGVGIGLGLGLGLGLGKGVGDPQAGPGGGPLPERGYP
jgi:hypothetical protein